MKKLPRPPAKAVWAAGVILIFLAKAGLTRFQMFYTWIDGAPLDDELMFRAAQSISAGQWLGPYDYLTLSKGMFFPVWLAGTHLLHLPYLAAAQLLWCAACLAMAQAMAPVLRGYMGRLALFAVLAFLPSAMASYTLRVYRDSIFPALCLLFFAGITGYALRCGGPLRRAWGWQLLAGAGLGAAWLCREDGPWLLPFAIGGAGVLAFVLLREKGLAVKPLRLALLGLPFAVLAGCCLAFCGMNRAVYGVFTLSDFSGGSFADAVGAMSRVQESEFTPLVSIPREVRMRIYETTGAMDRLEYWLEEDPRFQNDFVNPRLGDYPAGSFYWALRRAAQKEGIYSSAQGAAAYWAQVAQEINDACDDGRLPSEGGRRSGTAPAVRSEYLMPVLREGLYSLWFCTVFRDCEPYYEELRTIGTAEDLAVWENYLGCRCNVAARENSDLPYYNPIQRAAYALLDAVRFLYALALAPALALALLLQACQAKRLLAGDADSRAAVCWWLLAGVLGMALLRAFMIAFVEVASFGIGTYVMYLATVHPLLAVYAAAGIQTGWEARPWHR